MRRTTESMAAARARMLDEHLRARGVRDEAVLQAMEAVPRECFMPEGAWRDAYEDAPYPIPEGQSISQPYVVAYMLEALALRPTDRLLEIGTGSGYSAAVASRVVRAVYSVERFPLLAACARQRLRDLDLFNVEIRVGDGTLGWPELAPFDAIVVTAAAPFVPPALCDQLEPGGRLVVPLGRPRGAQRLVLRTRAGDCFDDTDLGEVRFVPLVGRHGWKEKGLVPLPPRP